MKSEVRRTSGLNLFNVFKFRNLLTSGLRLPTQKATKPPAASYSSTKE